MAIFPISAEAPAAEEDEFLSFRSLLLLTLSNYLKDIRNDGSWVHFYVSQLRLRAPGFGFEETRKAFQTKLEHVLDLMELAHLYCKIGNPKEYSAANHVLHREQHKYLLEAFEKLSDSEFFELRQYLKSNVMFGSN